jgi:hypothetical protein
MDASLTDVSGEGFQVVIDEDLAPGTMIAVETDAHVMLAEVRNHHKRGTRFAVGARKVHSVSKLDLAENAGRIETVQILINDYQLRLRKESAVEKARAPQAEKKVEERVESGSEDSFEPRPMLAFHAIPEAGKPSLPSLAGMAPERRSK